MLRPLLLAGNGFNKDKMLRSLAVSLLCSSVLIVSSDLRQYRATASCSEAVRLICSLAWRKPKLFSTLQAGKSQSNEIPPHTTTTTTSSSRQESPLEMCDRPVSQGAIFDWIVHVTLHHNEFLWVRSSEAVLWDHNLQIRWLRQHHVGWGQGKNCKCTGQRRQQKWSGIYYYTGLVATLLLMWTHERDYKGGGVAASPPCTTDKGMTKRGERETPFCPSLSLMLSSSNPRVSHVKSV